MTELLPFLAVPACPIGMATMMGLPVLARRFKRRAESAPAGGG